jgi:hypothetical protein
MLRKKKEMDSSLLPDFITDFQPIRTVEDKRFNQFVQFMAVFWVVAPCREVLLLLVNFYQTTRRYNPEDSHLHTHCRENLKS